MLLGLPQEQKREAQALPAEWRERRVDRMDEMHSSQGEDRAAPSPPSPREMVPGFHVGGEGHTQAMEMPGKAQGLCQKTPVWMLPECGQGHLQGIKGETRVSEVRQWVRAPDSYVWTPILLPVFRKQGWIHCTNLEPFSWHFL